MVNKARNICADDSLYTKHVACSVKMPVYNNLSPMHNVGDLNSFNLRLVHNAKQYDSLVQDEMMNNVNQMLINDSVNNDLGNKNLLLAFQNIEGFNQAKLEFINFFKNLDPAMLAIAEHWFMFDCDIPKFPNFKLWSKCRKNGKRGGVAVYVDE